MRYVTLILAVEAKEAPGGSLPDDSEVAALSADLLCDATKRDFELPWRVVSVEPGLDR